MHHCKNLRCLLYCEIYKKSILLICIHLTTEHYDDFFFLNLRCYHGYLQLYPKLNGIHIQKGYFIPRYQEKIQKVITKCVKEGNIERVPHISNLVSIAKHTYRPVFYQTHYILIWIPSHTMNPIFTS